ncbi:MAG TPA: homoserine O-succinyltransferase [Polyangiales bacterium]
MPLLVPRHYAPRAALAARGVHCLTPEAGAPRGLRVGIINLMPAAERYEPLLLSALGRGPELVEPAFIRLRGHAYESSDAEHLAAHYHTYEDTLEAAPLAGLILTGAPVEELAFDEVRYFPELQRILHRSREQLPSTLGLCWGGMALAHLLGLEKGLYPRKLFGRFALKALPTAGANLAGEGQIWCMQSRHAGIGDDVIERAAGRGEVAPLAHSAHGGYSVFVSSDQRYVMHLGHPEYDRARILFEYRRDLDKGRGDVPSPEGVDPNAPDEQLPCHGPEFFSRWLASLASHPTKR